MLERESCPILDGNTVDTLFNGQSGNTLMDTINYERYSILQQKYVKMTAPNKGTKSGYGASGHGTKGGSYLGVEVALGRRLELAVEARVLEEPVARVVGRHRRVVQLLSKGYFAYKKNRPLGPYSRTKPRALWCS